jgi:hypothetical protein
MIVRITVSSKLGPCVDPAMPGPCVFPGGVSVCPGGVCVSPGGVNISPGDGAPGLAMSPARAEPDSTHASAIANAKRFIIYSPLRIESCEDRIEHYHPRCLSKCCLSKCLPKYRIK